MYGKVGSIYSYEANKTLEELNDDLFRLHIPTLVFMILGMVVGIIGNGLVIIVYKTRFRRSNHRYFILFVAVADFLACAIGMPFLIASLRLPYLMSSSAACKIVRCFHYFVNNSSGLLLVVIAIERFRKIVHPFKKQLSVRQTLFLCYAVFFISIAMAVPAPIVYKAVVVETGVANITGLQCYVDDRYHNWFEIYQAILMVEALLSIAIIAVLYSFIVRKLCTNDQFMQAIKSMNSASSGSNRSGNSRDDYSQDNYGETESPQPSEICRQEFIQNSDGNENGLPSSPLKSLNHLTGSAETVSIGSKHAGDKHYWRKSVDIANASKEHGEVRSAATRSTSDVTLNRLNQPKKSNTITPTRSIAIENLLKKKAMPSESQKNRTYKNSRTTVRVTVMLLTVSIAFALSFIPHLALMIVTSHDTKFLGSLNEANYLMYQFFLRIFILNNIINPFIYWLCETKFRKESRCVLKSILCCCCK